MMVHNTIWATVANPSAANGYARLAAIANEGVTRTTHSNVELGASRLCWGWKLSAELTEIDATAIIKAMSVATGWR